MQIPKHYVHKWVILVLGKHGRLSGKQIYEESRKENECSKLILPKYESSYYGYLRKIEEKGLIEQVDERRVRGTLERFYSLTQKGKKVFNELLDLFVIENMTPADFLEMQSECSTCEQDNVEKCWEIYVKDLEVTLNGMKDVFPKFRLQPLNLLKQEFKTPGHLQEFIFWLHMLKLPKRRLKDKFADQMNRLGLTLVGKSQ